jgi:hypothetical protein
VWLEPLHFFSLSLSHSTMRGCSGTSAQLSGCTIVFDAID